MPGLFTIIGNCVAYCRLSKVNVNNDLPKMSVDKFPTAKEAAKRIEMLIPDGNEKIKNRIKQKIQYAISKGSGRCNIGLLNIDFPYNLKEVEKYFTSKGYKYQYDRPNDIIVIEF